MLGYLLLGAAIFVAISFMMPEGGRLQKTARAGGFWMLIGSAIVWVIGGASLLMKGK